MKTYLNYKNQLEGLNDVYETAKTAEKIAATAMHFFKKEKINLDNYVQALEKVLSRFLQFHKNLKHPLLAGENSGKIRNQFPAPRRDQAKQSNQASSRQALVLVSGDKGLVGDLWHRVVNKFLAEKNKYHSVIALGAKGQAFLEEEAISPAQSFINIFNTSGEAKTDDDKIKEITSYVLSAFEKKEFSAVDVIYPRFISLADQQIEIIPLLPFDFKLMAGFKGNNQSAADQSITDPAGLPIFEPGKPKLFDELLAKYIQVFFRRIIGEARLSELSARIVSTESATAKTKKLMHELSLSYQKQHHRNMTQQQLEIFSSRQARAYLPGRS